MRWPWKRLNSNGRLVVSWAGQTLAYVHTRLGADGFHEVLKFGTEQQGLDSTKNFVRRLQALGLTGLDACVMLRPEQYQFLQIDAPAVPPEELHSAVRYQIRDLLKISVNDVALDVMRVGDGLQQKGAPQLFVVATANTVVQEVLAISEAMNWNVAVIDVQETAQRNLQSALAWQDGGADRTNAALVLAAGHPALLTISGRQELFYTRRIALPEDFFLAPLGRDDDATFSSMLDSSAGDDDKMQRFVLEVQRSLDLWSRSWVGMPLDEVRVYAGERSADLSTWFGEQLGLAVLSMDFSSLFPGFEGGTERDQGLCLPLLGVLMRTKNRQR